MAEIPKAPAGNVGALAAERELMETVLELLDAEQAIWTEIADQLEATIAEEKARTSEVAESWRTFHYQETERLEKARQRGVNQLIAGGARKAEAAFSDGYRAGEQNGIEREHVPVVLFAFWAVLGACIGAAVLGGVVLG